jgi:predicted NAD-dependent protein-ADP-ribosyltransferase YbiA (DUF1768 family)
MEKEPEFIIPSFTDYKNGYLNMSSTLYKFTIDDKVWLSVEHYRLAKRFEGSLLEEQIRKAKTVALAKTLAKPRSIIKDEDGIITKEMRYGKDNTFIREDWRDQDPFFIEVAVLAKFTQNQKAKNRLIATEGIHFIDKTCPHHSIVLEKTRSYLIKESKMIRIIIEMPHPTEDIKDKYIKSEEMALLKNFTRLIKALKKMESFSKDTPIEEGMILDVLYNLITTSDQTAKYQTAKYQTAKYQTAKYQTAKYQKKILKTLDTWLIGLSWSDITNQMPNFENLIQAISNYFSKNLPPPGGIPPSKRLHFSMKVAALFRWHRWNPILKCQLSSDLYIPPVRRSYRGKAPQSILIEKELPTALISNDLGKSATYIELFQTHPTVRGKIHSRLVNYFECLNPHERKVKIENFEKSSFGEQKIFIDKISKLEKV